MIKLTETLEKIKYDVTCILYEILKKTDSVALRYSQNHIEDGGDIDILTKRASYISTIINAISILEQHKALILKVRVKPGIAAIYFMVKKPQGELCLILDIRTAITKKGYWLTNLEHLNSRGLLIRTHDRYYELTPSAEAALLLCRNSYDRRPLNSKHKELISRADEDATRLALRHFPVSKRPGFNLTEPTMNDLPVEPSPSLQNVAKRYTNALMNRIVGADYESPTHIAILGPDGVGKTGVAKIIHEKLQAFGKVAWFHFYQNGLAAETEQTNTQTDHSIFKKISNKSSIFTLLSFARFINKTHTKTIKSYKDYKFMIHDRFLIDYMFKKKKNGVVPFWLSKAYKLFPFDRDALQIILEDTPEAIIDRKAELNFNEIKWIYSFLKSSLPKQRYRVIYLDITNSRSSHQTATMCLSKVSEWICNDVARTLKKSK